MQRVAVLLIVFASVIASAAPLAADDKDQTPDYYPLKVGTKWHYQIKVAGDIRGNLMTLIAKIDKIDDQPLARLETHMRGDVFGSEHLKSSAQGVFRYRVNGIDATPPVCLLRYPIKEDDAWDTETQIGGQKVKVACRLGSDEVEVTAGKYKTVRVNTLVDTPAKTVRTTFWFAAGVGIVKQSIETGGQTTLIELERFEAGK